MYLEVFEILCVIKLLYYYYNIRNSSFLKVVLFMNRVCLLKDVFIFWCFVVNEWSVLCSINDSNVNKILFF